MKTEQELKTELSEKMQQSFAKGGFLTTDLGGEWECDEKSIIDWVLARLKADRREMVEEILEEVQIEVCWTNDSQDVRMAINQERQRIRHLLTSHLTALDNKEKI